MAANDKVANDMSRCARPSETLMRHWVQASCLLFFPPSWPIASKYQSMMASLDQKEAWTDGGTFVSLYNTLDATDDRFSTIRKVPSDVPGLLGCLRLGVVSVIQHHFQIFASELRGL